MSEKAQRIESIQPLYDVALSMSHELGEHPQQRLNWLMEQDGDSFGEVLKNINSIVRGLDHADHNFDGEGVQAGTVGGSVPPDQEDKEDLLDKVISASKQHIDRATKEGKDAQHVISEIAVALPTVLNKLHLFADGNGRTTRILRMLLRDGDQITAEHVNALINKSGVERYDATPGTPIEISIGSYAKELNGTSEITIDDDVVGKETFAEDAHLDIQNRFPALSSDVVGAYSDTENFAETIRLMSKEKGLQTVKISEIFSGIVEDPQELSKFTDTYRRVRKQRVELLISGLLGESNIPLQIENKAESIHTWINSSRERIGLSPIDPEDIETIRDFQIAYCETFSPKR